MEAAGLDVNGDNNISNGLSKAVPTTCDLAIVTGITQTKNGQ